MIHIDKQDEPCEVLDWKQKFKRKNRRNPNYDDITKVNKIVRNNCSAKNILKDGLIKEQKGICCYCCNEISSLNSHIEHFRPKGRAEYADFTLTYENLHASCQGIYNSKDTCGHNKHGEFDEQLMISPLEKDCAKYFKYNEFGEVLAVADNERAAYTIRVLNLNDDRLTKARQIAIDNSGALNIMDEDERNLFVEEYTMPDENGKLPPFCDALSYLFTHC